MIPQDKCAPLDERRLRAALAGHAVGCEVQVHEMTASTSDLARELGSAGHPHGAVVFAESQTAGRGRRENRWNSAAREDLLFSVLLRPDAPVEKWPRLSTLAALGLSRAVEESCGIRPQIKWPNDLLAGGRKFCGILAEMFGGPGGPFMVLGVGINVNSTRFPPELEDSATSLRLAGDGRELDRTRLAISVLRQLEATLTRWTGSFERVIDEVKARSFLLGKRVRAMADGTVTEGTACGLDEEGRLAVRTDDGATIILASVEQVRVA